MSTFAREITENPFTDSSTYIIEMQKQHYELSSREIDLGLDKS
jgi:hypothetical protein